MRLATIFRERRRETRRQSDSTARLKIGDRWTLTTLVNLSPGGAALLTAERPAPESQVLVEITDLGFFLCRVVRHLEGGVAVQFESATFPETEISADRTEGPGSAT